MSMHKKIFPLLSIPILATNLVISSAPYAKKYVQLPNLTANLEKTIEWKNW